MRTVRVSTTKERYNKIRIDLWTKNPVYFTEKWCGIETEMVEFDMLASEKHLIANH